MSNKPYALITEPVLGHQGVAPWEYEQCRNTKCLLGLLILLCYISLHLYAIVTVHCLWNLSMLNSKY